MPFHQRFLAAALKSHRSSVTRRLILGVDAHRVVREGVFVIVIMHGRAIIHRAQIGHHRMLARHIMQAELIIMVVLAAKFAMPE